jgi:hypothetical protein
VFSVRGPCRGVILKKFGATTKFKKFDCRVEVGHGKFVVEEEIEFGL